MWSYLNSIPCLDVKSGPTGHLLDFWIDLPSKDPQHVFLLCISLSFVGFTSIVILGFERVWSHTRASDIYVKLGLMFCAQSPLFPFVNAWLVFRRWVRTKDSRLYNDSVDTVGCSFPQFCLCCPRRGLWRRVAKWRREVKSIIYSETIA